MQRDVFARLVVSSAVAAVLTAGCFTPVGEAPPDAGSGGCPAGEDCGGGMLPDAGCPIGQICAACDAGLVLVDGACVSATDAGPIDAGPIDAGPVDAGPVDAGPPGQACLSGTLSDAESMTPIAGAAVIATDSNGLPYAGAATTSGTDGSFTLCPPTGATFTTQINAAGYPVTYFESAVLSKSESLGSLPLISTEVIGALGSFLQGFVSTDAALLIPVRSLSGGCSVAGWSVEASLPDGGAIPGTQTAYLESSGLPSTTLTSTTTEGAAVIYDIDPSLTGQVVVSASNPNEGSCAPDGAALGLTGMVEVGGAAISIAPIVLP